MRSFLFAIALAASASFASAAEYSWQPSPTDPDQWHLFDGEKQVGGYCYRHKAYRPLAADGWGEWQKSPAQLPPTALEEVNATRRARGLRPYLHDALLAVAARRCAAFRAASLIEGHSSNDFAFLPAGANASAAGCAAWHPSMGWGSCCQYESWQYAGAAWSMGRDGRRYMHIFVR